MIIFKPEDLVITTFTGRKQDRISMDAGICIEHVPTKIKLCVDDDRLQYKNKAIALKELTNRLEKLGYE